MSRAPSEVGGGEDLDDALALDFLASGDFFGPRQALSADVWTVAPGAPAVNGREAGEART